jgi:hypothetical protein
MRNKIIPEMRCPGLVLPPSKLTFALLVLDLSRAEMFSFLQYYDLRCLVVSIVLVSAPGIARRTLRDGRPTGYGRPARTVILEFRVLVTIIAWISRDAALKLAQESRGVL